MPGGYGDGHAVRFLAPILTLQALEEVELLLSREVPLSDADIRAFVDAWPHLRRFTLDLWDVEDLSWYEEAELPFTLPTIQSLVDFATRTPALVWLRIPCVSIDPHTPFRDIPLMDHPLLHLSLGNLKAGKGHGHIKAGALLDRLFPDLDFSDARFIPTEEADSRWPYAEWRRVQQVLLAIQNGRKSRL
ncbi:hypothetical protein BD311DRAFT_866012 [Dichomitus squalens]|uniref:F-box domain-containing protein n=1 Tax=Dichomitus squalens TaxID=114155 RepID=A0A4Q9MMN5_9APHY|nr:hypothetical protein BD311DRAFT_866012 [Dichomitus squalens]